MGVESGNKIVGNIPPAAGRGRPKGALNKTTRAAREAIADCFEGMGGTEALQEWAEKNPKEFYTIIWPKIIPLHVGGDPDSPLIPLLQVEFVDGLPDPTV